MTDPLIDHGRGWLRAAGIGIGVAVLTALFMLAAAKAGLTPFPKPPSLAFAETVLGHPVPLPIGLIFHLAYVTFWSVVFVRYFPRRGIGPALALAGVLWIGILLVFFPLLGWGFAGLAISPRLIPASFVPHLLFGLFLWLLHRYVPMGRASLQ